MLVSNVTDYVLASGSAGYYTGLALLNPACRFVFVFDTYFQGAAGFLGFLRLPRRAFIKELNNANNNNFYR